jgi:methylmalonyl-CoA mutase N-terminal domain/subunit
LIYTDIAITLADARQYASSVTQLLMIDQVTRMLAMTLGEYNKFNEDLFFEKAKHGYGVPIHSTWENQ